MKSSFETYKHAANWHIIKLFLSLPFFGLSIISAQVTQYLLDKTLIMDEDTLYDLSLKIEPRLPA